MKHDDKREFTWGEMAAGYAVLFMYCVAVVFGLGVKWLFNLPGRAVRGVKR